MSNDTKTEVLDILNLINQGINSAKVSNEVLLNLTTNDYITAGENLAKLAQERENNKNFLKHVTDIMLAGCDSIKSIADAPEIFPGYHDGNLKNWKLDESQPKTEAQKLSVYEMQQNKNGNFQEIFGSLNRPIESLLIKQNQILQFVTDHADLLHLRGYATLFLVERESDKARFVVRVYRRAGKLEVYVDKFSYDRVWSGENLYRVVVPAEDTK